MDENEMMDPSVIKGLFEQGVRNSLLPFLCILLTFVSAHGHRNKRRSWRRRILVHLGNNCHRRARQSRSFGICFVRRSQYARKHRDPQIRYSRTTGEVVASACRVKGSSAIRVWSSTRSLTYFIAWQLLFVRDSLRFRRVCSPNACHEGWGQLDHQWFQNVDHKLV
jgi:hypothetical protein